jgi:hypothetical protein
MAGGGRGGSCQHTKNFYTKVKGQVEFLRTGNFLRTTRFYKYYISNYMYYYRLSPWDAVIASLPPSRPRGELLEIIGYFSSCETSYIYCYTSSF